MTERDALETVSDGDQLNEGYFNDIEDHISNIRDVEETDAYGSVSNSTSETEIGEISVGADECSAGMVVIAVVQVRIPGGTNVGTTLRLRTGTSDTATSNTERLSVSRHIQDDTGATYIDTTETLVWFCNEEILSGAWKVHITAQPSSSSAVNSATLKSLVGLKL